MATSTRTVIGLVAVTLFMTGVLGGTVAVAAKTDKLVSFSGSFQGHENDLLQGNPPTTISVDGRGTGIATHLGRFTWTWAVTVTLPIGSATGSGQLTAANGDTIYATILGQGSPTDTPGLNQIVEVATITGGTGRFSNAQGSFTIDRLVDLNTGLTSGSLHGSLSH